MSAFVAFARSTTIPQPAANACRCESHARASVRAATVGFCGNNYTAKVSSSSTMMTRTTRRRGRARRTSVPGPTPLLAAVTKEQRTEDAFEAEEEEIVDASSTSFSSSKRTCELVSNVDNRFTVKGTIFLSRVNADDVYNMLTDYENASKVFPSTIKKVEYLGYENDDENDDASRTSRSESGNKTRTKGGIKHIKQTCNWKFFIFGGNFNIELGVVENDSKRHMTCTLKGAASQRKFGFLREFEGSWEVEENGEEGAKVTHVLSVKPSLTPPYASDIFVKQVEGILEDVEREVQSWENGYAVPMHRR